MSHWAVKAQAFNPSSLEAEVGGLDLYEFEANLIYKVSSRTKKQDYYTEKPCFKNKIK